MLCFREQKQRSFENINIELKPTLGIFLLTQIGYSAVVYLRITYV
jgi:hypothetical protein